MEAEEFDELLVLLGQREFHEEDHFRLLVLRACGSKNPRFESPTTQEPIHLEVSVFPRKIRRFTAFSLDPWDNLTDHVVGEEAEDTTGQEFSMEVSPVVSPVEWQSAVVQMMEDCKLVYAATRLRLSQELASFLNEMAREARDRGLGVLYIGVWVEEVVTLIRNKWRLGCEYQMMEGSDGVESGEVEEEPVIQEISIGEPIAGEICVICQEEFSAELSIVQLICSHFFHFDCIHPWLLRNFQCPICRYKLPLQRLI